jgi:hypothetical protein
VSVVVFIASLVLFAVVMAGLASLIHDMVRVLDADDETCAQIDAELERVEAQYRWKGGGPWT